MVKEPRIAAFMGGELKILAEENSCREVVLALPLSRLLLKMVRVAAGADPLAVATPILKALSPFPDEPLTVACETVRADEAGGSIVIAAALPESAADDIAEALDAAKLTVVSIDALVFGALRQFWGELNISDSGRRLLRLKSSDGLALVVLDGGEPASLRAIADEADLPRETMLSLLEAEDFNGPKDLVETIDREVTEDALAGVKARAGEASSLNALPESWREVLAETRFKAKLVKRLAVAGAVWALVMGILFGVPVAYGFMTDHMKGLCRDHSKAYKAVADKKAKVELIQKYSDHARGALEIMKALSDRLPPEITLVSWDFTRDGGVTVRGESDDSDAVYKFKESLEAMETEGDADAAPERIFPVVEMGPLSAKKGKQSFEITCGYETEEEK